MPSFFLRVRVSPRFFYMDRTSEVYRSGLAGNRRKRNEFKFQFKNWKNNRKFSKNIARCIESNGVSKFQILVHLVPFAGIRSSTGQFFLFFFFLLLLMPAKYNKWMNIWKFLKQLDYRHLEVFLKNKIENFSFFKFKIWIWTGWEPTGTVQTASTESHGFPPGSHGFG
jgi:hypothetical protein